MSEVLVIGGGFAGMWAALSAAREFALCGRAESVVLVAPEPYLTIRPRLYEAGPQSMRAPLGPLLETAGVRFVQGEVQAIDADARAVSITAPGGEAILNWSRLVVATGSAAHAPDIPGLAEHGFSVDDYSSALKFDAHLARICTRPLEAPATTFAIVGGGFTGIELACEMRDRIAAHANEHTAQIARIVLIEQAGEIGPDLGPGPRAEILAALEAARIELRLGARIVRIGAEAVHFGNGDALPSQTVVTTAGQRALIPRGLEAAHRDRLGRLHTDTGLRVEGYDDIFAAGDAAFARVDEVGHTALMSCQHAMPMGRFAGSNAARSLLGRELLPYRQERYVTCLSLGRSGAVFTSGWDRTVQKTGAEAGALKQAINTKWIYPPEGSRDELFALANPLAQAAR
ncbi:MAG: NAD(P)/FAD-dependent oxidoreductase [Beijerinckiaceae bacterium]